MEERRENEADERVRMCARCVVVVYLCMLCAGENAIDRRSLPQAKVSARCVLAIIFDVVLLNPVDALVCFSVLPGGKIARFCREEGKKAAEALKTAIGKIVLFYLFPIMCGACDCSVLLCSDIVVCLRCSPITDVV